MRNKVKTLTSNKPLCIGSSKLLFIDDRLVEFSTGLTRCVNPPQKARIVLKPETDLEAGCIQGFVNVFEDPMVPGKYLMYYIANPERFSAGWIFSTSVHLCRAVSNDGIHWEREKVGIYEINGNRDNNVVLPINEFRAHVAFFPDPDPEDNYPYKILGEYKDPKISERTDFITGLLYLWRSMDGKRWERCSEPVFPFAADSNNQCFFDKRLGKYVAYIRGLTGRQSGKDGGFISPLIKEGPRSRSIRCVKRVEIENLSDFPWPFQSDTNRTYPAERCVGELPTVMEADENDPPFTDIYTSAVYQYPYAQDVYYAFPSLYRHFDGYDSHGRDNRGKLKNDGVTETQLAVSRDGICFTRFRESYLRPGRIGEIDGGYSHIGNGIIKRGDELYQYYVANPYTHGMDTEQGVQYTSGLPREAVVRLVQRLDGFVSLDADRCGGELITPVLKFTGDRLQLNIDCGGLGEVWTEIQNESGQAIEGFSLAESVSVDRNGTAQEVWWHGGPDVSSLAGKPVRVRIKMRSAKLFACQFVSTII